MQVKLKRQVLKRKILPPSNLSSGEGMKLNFFLFLFKLSFKANKTGLSVGYEMERKIEKKF